MPGAGRQAEPLGGAGQQGAALGVGLGDGREQRAVGVGVAARLGPVARPIGQQPGGAIGLDGQELALAIELGEALALDGARGGDAGRDIGRALGRRRQGEVGRRSPAARRCRSMRSSSGPEMLALVVRPQRGARRRPGPAPSRWPQRQGFIAATSWKRAGIGDVGVGARHGDAARSPAAGAAPPARRD